MRPSFYSLLTAVTDIGDSASLLAIVGAGSLYLLSRKSRRAALFLLGSFLLAVISIALAKLAFIGCRAFFHRPDIQSPSGHAALSAAVFWAYAILMRSHLAPNRRFLPLLLLSLLIVAIAISRVALHDHSAAEVWLGLFAGSVSLFIAYFFILKGKAIAPFDAYVLALWGVAAAFVTHGMRFPAEHLIHLLAFHLRSHAAFCG